MAGADGHHDDSGGAPVEVAPGPDAPGSPTAGRTIGSVLDQTGGMAPGFDGMRVCLAILVVVWHQHRVLYGEGPGAGLVLTLISQNTMPMFFGMAGFLVAASTYRLSRREFALNRLLRILPALAVEIVLSAFILGPIFTSLPLADYFSHPQTYAYLSNVVGVVNFHLPGVFATNPVSVVNASLWTIPFELGCYGVALGTLLLGLNRRPVALALLTAGWTVGVLLARTGWGGFDTLPGALVEPMLASNGAALIIYFLAGMTIFALRRRIPCHRAGAALAAGLVLAAGLFPHALVIAVFPIVYLTVFVSLMRLPPIPLLRRGDYSYGIYLYGMPVQQAVRAVFPDVQNYAVSLALVFVFLLPMAMFSWHVIEKPVLRMRRRFSFVARARGVANASESAVAAPPPVVDAGTGTVISYGSAASPAGQRP